MKKMSIPMTSSPTWSAAKLPSMGAFRPWAVSASSLSTSSGVYWFKNADNEILYIGKAKNLKQRIGSYKLPRILDPKTAKLVSLAVSLHCQVTDTEIDALILEANLINQYQPPYNRLLKDDKTPCYLYFTKPPASTLKIVRFTDLPARLPTTGCSKTIKHPVISILPSPLPPR